MKTLKTFGLVLLVLAALGVVTAASASAETPKTLFLEGKTSTTFTGTSGKGHLSTKGVPVSIECTKGKDAGTIESKGEGTLTLTFEGCTLLGTKCKSAGATNAGEIVTSGTYSTVYDAVTPFAAKLLPALLLKITEVTIECPSVGQTLKVKGNILLLFGTLTSGTEVTSTSIIVTVSSGKPGDTNYWLSSVTGETKAEQEAKVLHPLLLTSVNGGTFEESGDESAENNVAYASMVGITF
jgi:hypothetical protein